MTKQTLWLLALLVMPAAGSAQDLRPDSVLNPDTVLQQILAESVRGGHHLRITAGSVVEGRVVQASASEVRLVGATVDVAEIIKLERRTVTGGGALEGGLAGAAAGALAATYVLGGLAGQSDGSGALLPVALVGAGIGGLLGLIIGALDDPPEKKWEVLWTRP